MPAYLMANLNQNIQQKPNQTLTWIFFLARMTTITQPSEEENEPDQHHKGCNNTPLLREHTKQKKTHSHLQQQ